MYHYVNHNHSKSAKKNYHGLLKTVMFLQSMLFCEITICYKCDLFINISIVLISSVVLSLRYCGYVGHKIVLMPSNKVN